MLNCFQTDPSTGCAGGDGWVLPPPNWKARLIVQGGIALPSQGNSEDEIFLWGVHMDGGEEGNQGKAPAHSLGRRFSSFHC